jgi:hypothetical protein
VLKNIPMGLPFLGIALSPINLSFLSLSIPCARLPMFISVAITIDKKASE